MQVKNNNKKVIFGSRENENHIFESLTLEELNGVIELRKHINLKKGEKLFLEGETIESIFIVSKGALKLIKSTSNGKEQIINILNSGDLAGEVNVFGKEKTSKVSAIAINESEVFEINKSDLDKLINNNPSILIKLLNGLSNKVIHLQNLTANLSENNINSRIACMLLEFLDKYKSQEGEEISINLPINRGEMANYCGVTRETISRKLSSYEKEKIIKLKGKKLIILNKESLEGFIFKNK
ncbi:Crp/Fnr family transcriptional regulator [Clostridium thermobutyricum]|uniref:cAMP receptor protein n=1 Tax=Clostridium thermobutyricum DSM 4928 TaxID=1121339 RepID=A0A1V4SZ14_9CLOT|nr:Crp/Fnr family transcriptional regulator [Clostridium thermobutyricum]OPX49529.1 cAMP receptor protein [Clostridium thermobutyricum DSM 4928]